MGCAPSRRVKRDDVNGIDTRSFRFLCDVLSLTETVERGPRSDRLIEQLVSAAGSIGSNREEALAASSRREFIRYNEIALRSANESVRWLRAFEAKRFGSHETCVTLIDEGRQLARILARIVITSKGRSRT